MEVFGLFGVFHGEVAYPGTAEGGQVGAGAQGGCEVGDEGADVGAAGAGDGEGCGVLLEGGELEGVDCYGAALAFDEFAAAVGFVEAFALYFDGGGHRRGLEYVAGEAVRGGA